MEEDYTLHRPDNYWYNVWRAMVSNWSYYAALLVSITLIGCVGGSFTLSVWTVVSVYMWSYFSHRWAHSKWPWRLFHGIHHTPLLSHKWWAVCFETLINMGAGGAVLIGFNQMAESHMQCRLWDTHILLYFTLLYTTSHMLNYHFLRIPTHRKHHGNTSTNFGPDLMDVIFDTKSRGEEFENLVHNLPNILVALIVVLYSYAGIETAYDGGVRVARKLLRTSFGPLAAALWCGVGLWSVVQKSY